MMLKKLNMIVFILLMVLGTVFTPLNVSAQADTLGELKDELAGLKQDKADNENSVSSTQAQINQKSAEIAAAYEAIEKARTDIEIAEKEIEESEKDIEELSLAAGELMVLFEQLSSNEQYLEYVTGASSLTELIMRMDAIEALMEYNRVSINNLETLIVETREKNLDLLQKQADLNKDIDSYEANIDTLKNDLSKFAEITEDIDDQIKNQQILIDYYEEIGCEDDEPLTSCVEMLANSGWMKPTTYGVVTSGWGYRTNPLTGSGTQFHSAVDIGGNREGTPTYSVANGTVAGITWKSSCGGNKIYIHYEINGKPYTVSYLHMLDVYVEVGETVYVDTVIGTVGGGSQTWWDDCSTGAHIHFGVNEGYYLGGGPHGYSSWSSYLANNIAPPGYGYVGWKYYNRTTFYR